MEVITNAMVVIIFKYISLSSQHIVHLKLTLYVNYIPNKAGVGILELAKANGEPTEGVNYESLHLY